MQSVVDRNVVLWRIPVCRPMDFCSLAEYNLVNVTLVFMCVGRSVGECSRVVPL